MGGLIMADLPEQLKSAMSELDTAISDIAFYSRSLSKAKNPAVYLTLLGSAVNEAREALGNVKANIIRAYQQFAAVELMQRARLQEKIDQLDG
jgi:hypothetical protein